MNTYELRYLKKQKCVIHRCHYQLRQKLFALVCLTLLHAFIACTNCYGSIMDDVCHIITDGSSLCITPKPFQPSINEIEFINQPHTKDEADDGEYDHDQFILISGVPFFHYWQLKDKEQYVFHAQAYGRFIFNNASHVDVQKITNRVGVNLPNNSLAFYYPNIYPLNRMNGKNLIYSAMSQSENLSGYMQYDKIINSQESRRLLLKVKNALFFPYEEGGVDLNIAQLEFPLFHSNPEIILNGWLHALLRLNDYALTYNDMEIANYIQRNLKFFADHHNVWYDTERNISRYSDSSPQSATIVSDNIQANFVVAYQSKIKEMKHYLIPLKDDPKKEISSYENKIISRNTKTKEIKMTLSCSGFFHSVLVSDSPFKMKIRKGGYNPTASTPTNEGEWYFLTSEPILEKNLHKIILPQEKLFCGYPTNFSKANNKNFYHMQHIVALLYLANYLSFSDKELSEQLIKIAKKWYENTKNFEYRTLEDFENPQQVLSAINRDKFIVQIQDIQKLFERSGISPWF